MRRIGRIAGQRVPELVGITLAMVVILVAWTSMAQAQSMEDQYGSRTPPPDPSPEGASAVISMLPDTGGLLPVGVLGGLAVIGLGVAILQHRRR